MRGAIHANQAAQNYRFRMDMTSAHTSTVASDIFAATGVLTIRWGGGATHVIQVQVQNTYDASLGIPSVQTITIADFWSADTTVTGTAWGTPRAILVEIDNAVLTVASDCDWELTFDEIRVYVDTVLKKTVTTNSDSGSGFDFREDTVTLRATVQDGITQPAFTGSSSPTSGVCVDSYASFVSSSAACSCSLEGGWQYYTGAWTSDTVEINNPALPTSTCTCIPSPNFPSFVTGHDYDSWYLEVAANYELDLNKTLGDFLRCDCTGGYEERQYWDWTYAYQFKIAEASALPRASRIYDHDYYAYTDCVIDTDTLAPPTVTEPVTYVWQETFSDRRTSLIHCWDLVDAVTCPEGEDPNPCLPAFPTLTDSICQTQVTTSVSWPTLPTCVVVSSGLTYHVRASRHVLGMANAGTLTNCVMDNIQPQTPVMAGTDTGDSLCIRWGPLDLHRWVDSSGSIIETRSVDGGISWTMARTIATGKWPAGFVGQDLRKRVYWVDGDAIKGEITDLQDNVIEAVFTVVASGVDDSGIAVWESVIENTRRVILWYTVGGSITEKISADGGVVFT